VSANPSNFNLKKAAFVCHHGGVISYPTESVFGLGCNPDNYSAVDKILQLKQRPIEKGLILIAASIKQLQPYIVVSSKDLNKITSQKNSPTTWLVKPSELTPYWITGQHEKVAVRLTQHPVAKHLCEQFPYPLVSTSANPGGKIPAKSSLKSRIYFGGNVDFYVGGSVGNLGSVTRIVDVDTGLVVREG
jgi:L-threonylcarbamoyladenylate synthase